MTRQPWIAGWAYDTAFILSPGFVVTAVLAGFRGYIQALDMTPLLWALLVVGVDVSHVYFTLYRTYFDPIEFRARRTLYLLVPLFGWLAFAGLYSLGEMVFWRVLAYLAVFHFVRQQYGFMMIYRRGEPAYPVIDKLAIYAATLYPLVWWHSNQRSFSWLIADDFVALPFAWIPGAALAVYAAILAAYAGKEILLWRRIRRINVPRNLLLAGTALSWWSGIMLLDNDVAFTAANVLAHGIPYIALIWRYGRNQASGIEPMPIRRLFSAAALPLFLAIPLLLAYLEEGVWDGVVWAEHRTVFPLFQALPVVTDTDVLVWLVPLLALPQITHYLLDAVIWRMSLPGTPWKRILFGR